MVEPTLPPTALPTATVSQKRSRAWQWVGWASLLLVISLVIWAGVGARWAMWDSTASIRYVPDMQNGWNWGNRSADAGYLHLYDDVVAQNPRGNYGLDYVPLRLAAMTYWAWQHGKDGGNNGQTVWKNTREFNAEPLALNMSCDFVSMVATAGLVFGVLRRAGRGTMTAAWAGVASGALLWLNPAVWVSGFGRPTWDVWVLPFFLLACWAAWGRWWAVSGAMLAVGAMFKGQQLAVVPFFVVWALVAGPGLIGGLRSLAHWAAGFMIGAGVVVSPWLMTRVVRPDRSVDWVSVGSVLLAMVLPLSVAWAWRRWRTKGKARSRLLLTATLLLTALALWLPPMLGKGSMAWFEVGFRYGADKFPDLEVGGSSSLAGILNRHYNWRSDSLIFGRDSMAAGWPELTIKQLLLGVYGLCAMTAGAAAGLRHRRDDPALLIAIPAVWICYFAFMPLMHERYLLWGAATAGLVLTLSPGLTLLGIWLSVLSWAMTLYVMLWGGDKAAWELLGSNGHMWSRWIRASYPGAGWAVIVASLVFLYVAWARPWTPRKKPAITETIP